MILLQWQNMINATDLRKGVSFLVDGEPYQVVKYFHQKIARGGGVVKITARNLIKGTVETKNFASSVKVEEIHTVKKKLQYLFNDDTNAFFMDPDTFDQVEMPISSLSETAYFLKEGESVNILFWDDKPIFVEVSPKVVLKVADTSPGVKGDTTSNVYKPAVLENGLTIKVPLFIKVGDKIKIDTKTKKYVERVGDK